ncbi:hypothetical protein Ahy_B10g103827 [Arachis hypogaea]|uniref:Protein FAR1-RELATED SEQUENCE n=1 Tax=Arachis hypogaea TaxID=3818 RepID=A0A444X479_ARAHY|nr:hypothetical protein Ahy_B10g103827 [Arachis hypogaea]
MKEKNKNFFFELNLEGDHYIEHAFWVDARSRAACEYFGDVVLFVTTYNTNRYLVQSHRILVRFITVWVKSGFRFFCGRESPRSVDTSRIRENEK